MEVAEAEKFLLLFDRTFSEHHEKKFNNENNANLDCEDELVSNILTKNAKKNRERIHSHEKVSKATKFLKIIDSFSHSIFDNKRDG